MVENISIFHIYYVTRDFDGLLKSELFGFSEFLSQTGGLLGVFLGFSILSAIEILFHLFLRTSCNKCGTRPPKRNPNSNDDANTSEPKVIKPFIE